MQVMGIEALDIGCGQTPKAISHLSLVLEILIELRWCLETFARALQDHLKALI
jgi:hypothetical protein